MHLKKITASESRSKINDMNTAIFANQLLFYQSLPKVSWSGASTTILGCSGASSAVNVGVVRNV